MRLRTLAGSLGVLLTLLPTAYAQEPNFQNDTDKTLYALGLVLAQKIAQFQLDAGELTFVQAGFRDGATHAEPRVAMDVYGPQIETMLRDKLHAIISQQQEAGAAYVAKFAAETGVEKTDSGLLFQQIEAGSGPPPSATATVKVNYHGTLVDGTEFDRSKEGEPATFSLNGVIACFREGLQKIGVGGKAKLVCPPDLAYGPQGSPPRVPGGATLIFDVELVDIVSPQKAEPANP